MAGPAPGGATKYRASRPGRTGGGGDSGVGGILEWGRAPLVRVSRGEGERTKTFVFEKLLSPQLSASVNSLLKQM